MKKIFYVVLLIFLLPSSVIGLDDKLKILICVNEFPGRSNGVAVLNQITGFLDMGHEVHIYSERLSQFMSEDVIKYDLIPKTFYKKVPSDLNTYDVIYCQSGDVGERVVLQFNMSGEPLVAVAFRGVDIGDISVAKTRYAKLFKRADLILPVCEYFKQKLIVAGADERKIMVHHSAIDLNKLKFAPKLFDFKDDFCPKIISVGRYVEKKGFEYLIRAIAILSHRYKDIQCTIIGDGRLREKMVEQITSLKLNNCVHLSDSFLSQEQVFSAINSSDIFVLPSVIAENGDNEGIPNVLKEAMACGVPVISTKNAGIPELIKDGYSGLLVNERDERAIVHAILKLSRKKNAIGAMLYNARKTIENEYEKTAVNTKLINIFLQMIKNKKLQLN